jgi:hypothetical protein
VVESEPSGVVFDEFGDQWPARPGLSAQRLGRFADSFSVITNALTNLGFVHVAPVRDAVTVSFEPSAVSPLAAIAAFYEIAARHPRCLIFTYPGVTGRADRCEIFDDVTEGLRRLEEAASRGRNAIRPSWIQALTSERRCRRKPDSKNPAATRSRAGEGARNCGAQVEIRGADRSVRLSRPLDAIAADDEWFGQLLGFWGGARRGRRLPANESLDALELLNLARGRAHIVDTLSSSPLSYRFRLWGAVNSYGSGYANRALGEMPAGLMRDDAIEDYRQVVTAGAPDYRLIKIVENAIPYSYTRLILPMAQDGRRVDRLIVLINERELAELPI